MTLREARERLVAMWPGRTVSVQVEAWHNPALDQPDYTYYVAAVLPGVNGGTCTVIGYASDFDALLLMAEAELRELDGADNDCEVE